jgi:nucleotide-binding universal stress UspA family protein
MSRFHNILVAVDFSQTSDDALAVAAEMSRVSHAQVHLVHVVPSAFQVHYGMEPAAFDFSGYLRQSEAAARARLPELAARHQLDPTRLTIAVLPGAPADEIVEYAEDKAIDLIVQGAHGHGFLDRQLIGSVAERVARRAPCSVLLVPHATRRLTTFEVKAAARVES